MHRKTLPRLVAILALTTLLWTPAAPALADGPHPAGPFGWLDSWLATVTSWFSAGSTQVVGSAEQTEGETTEDPQPAGVPDGLSDGEDGNDEAGASIDPLG